MEKKEHYKLFKAGKLWCTMAIATVAAVAGLTMSTMNVAADTTSAPADVSTTQVTTSGAVANTGSNTEQQTGNVNGNNTQSSAGQHASQQVDYQTPVNAGYLDSAKEADNGNVQFSGWHATNQYSQGMHHFVIVVDNNNHELYRHEVTTVSRPDVAKLYPKAPVAEQGGFSVDVPADKLSNTDQIKLVSRYTTDAAGNQAGNGADFWFPAITTKAGWLDQLSVHNNQITVSGWHVDDQAVVKKEHTIILYDQSKRREAGRVVVNNTASPDLARAGYATIANANQARFSASFAISPEMMGDLFTVISRYNVPGEQNNSYSDIWFNNSIKLNNSGNAGYMDHFSVNKAQKKITISGWHAADNSVAEPVHEVILFDRTTNRELARKTVETSASQDVVRVYPGIYNAGQSRFSVDFDLTSAMLNHQLVVISRYAQQGHDNDNGHYTDYWYNGNVLNLTTDKQGYLDNFTLDRNNGVVNISGWAADDASSLMPTHTIILFNKTDNKEVARQTVTNVVSPDITRSGAGYIANAGNCRFSTSFKISPEMVGKQLVVVSRYSDGANDSDYWFTNKTVNFNVNQAAYLDNFTIDKGKGKVYVSGWHADDASIYMPGHYIILFDKTAGHEIAHKQVPVTDSLDVANAGYGYIAHANKARFSTSFDIVPEMVGHQLEIISRYSNSDTPDYGTATSDYWFDNNVQTFAVNQQAYLDQFNLNAQNRTITVSGWHADDAVTYMPGHFLILFDKTANHEVAHAQVPLTASDDVARVVHITGANKSRFTYTFKLTPEMLNHQLTVLSRYSNSETNDYGTATSDYWFDKVINLDQQDAWLDNLSQNGNTIYVSGWHTADSTVGLTHHVVLLYDYTTGREVARHEVTNTASPDLAANHGWYVNAANARFSTNFTVDPGITNHTFGIISRYSNQSYGEGTYSQYWMNNRYLNAYQNPGWMYQIQYSQIQANPAEVGHNIGPGYEGVKTWFIKSRLGDANIHNQYTYGDAYAIMNIQRQHGLPATGWVDLPTWRALGYSDDLWYGIDSYVSPTLTNPGATRADRINAMINTAYRYMGKPWWAGCSSAPYWGVDCSGLVMQALYGAGINPTTVSSTHHGYPGNEWNSRNLFVDPHLMNIAWRDRQRGDLVFYYAPGTRTIIHVAILIDPNTVIESWPPCVMVQPIQNGQRYVIAGIRRVFA